MPIGTPALVESGRQANRRQPGLGGDERVGRKCENRPATIAKFFSRRRQYLLWWKQIDTSRFSAMIPTTARWKASLLQAFDSS